MVKLIEYCGFVKFASVVKFENRDFRWLLTFGIFGVSKPFRDVRKPDKKINIYIYIYIYAKFDGNRWKSVQKISIRTHTIILI